MDILRKVGLGIAIVILSEVLLMASVQAAPVSDVSNTRHNLSVDWGGQGVDPRDVKAVSEQRICVFCHTPHGAQATPGAPLWNRSLSTEAYSMYGSSSMDAAQPGAPANSSKLCLSCHDGTLAIGAVNVHNGGSATIAMLGTNGNMMPAGDGDATGYTRNLGVDLSNDHPISITYDDNLAVLDGEFYSPTTAPQIGVRSPGVKPSLPLVVDHNDGVAKVECVTCHDPHVRSDNEEDIKFLRLNRYQANTGPNAAFNANNDIICLGCHKKEGWQDSAHANLLVADETYTTTAAAQRDFPAGIPVWRAACLNCHDTHTVAGSRRLLREGTDDLNTPKSGGNPAIEETCYQCHSNDGAVLTNQGTGSSVPDIKTDFNSNRRMPIASIDQPAGTEVHDIGTGTGSQLGKDFIESPLLLGKGNLDNRHAECTDCHNPHRVTKNRLASDNPAIPAAAGTHDHSGIHSNLISGVLRGTWGVEPRYASAEFTQIPISFDVKRGVPPVVDGTMNVGDGYVTREYQICLKCHSNYAFDDASGIAGYNNIGRPGLGTYNGGTPYGTNNVTVYTNQAMEFQAPDHHQGSPLSSPDSGAHMGQVTGYKYFSYSWNALWSIWEIDLALNTMPDDCDGLGRDDPSCVCEACTGADITYGLDNKVTATCGVADVNTFASTGIPGYSDSPWDGATWSGTVAAPPPYSANKCTKTVNYTENNHRSWHPVMKATGRTPTVRDLGADTAAFLPPWDAGIGTQTMYCSDCHGSDTAAGTAVPNGGEDGNPWGPHGSQNDFLLKGAWNEQTGAYQSNDLCFKCHDYNVYANPDSVSTTQSGFSAPIGGSLCGSGRGDGSRNLHAAHAAIYHTGNFMPGSFKCSACHVAVPHGWKNKALLVNLKDVGAEAGLLPGTEIKATQLPYNNGPYYLNAVNYIYNFKPSGQWTAADCGDSTRSGVGGMVSACGNLP